MAGSKYKYRDESEEGLEYWQIRAKRIIEPKLAIPENREVIEDIRRLYKKKEWDQGIYYVIMPLLRLPRNCYEFIKHYMQTQEQDYTLIKRAQVKVLSVQDQTLGPSMNPKKDFLRWVKEEEWLNIPELFLILDPWITKEELMDYLDKRFTKDIDPKLGLLRPGPNIPVRPRPKLKRDTKVLSEVAKGKSNTEIAQNYRGDDLDIPEEVIQIKKRRNKDKHL
jgi:hypothetical protein